jgi:hypothetical protein
VKEETLSLLSAANEVQYIESWQWGTTRNAEMVQAARHLHHALRDACCGEAQDIFDNAAAFDPGDRVLDDDTRTGEARVEELLTDAPGFACGLFGGCLVWVPAGSYP